VVPEVGLKAAGPVALTSLLPLRRLLHLWLWQVVERHVLPVTAAAPEAASAQHPGHGRERWDVLLVVPLVELGLELRHDVHRVQEQSPGAGGRELVPGQELIALEAPDARG